MKIKVNVDAIGTPLDEHVENKLTSSGLPTCLGSMIPPIITRQVSFEDLDILVDKEAISEKETVVSDVSKVIDADATCYHGKVIGKNGVEQVEKYKVERAGKYIEQLVKCCSCTYVNVCDKLTKNYLRVISIQETIKLHDVIKSEKSL